MPFLCLIAFAYTLLVGQGPRNLFLCVYPSRGETVVTRLLLWHREEKPNLTPIVYPIENPGNSASRVQPKTSGQLYRLQPAWGQQPNHQTVSVETQSPAATLSHSSSMICLRYVQEKSILCLICYLQSVYMTPASCYCFLIEKNKQTYKGTHSEYQPYWHSCARAHVALCRSAFLDCASSMSGGHTALMMSAVNLACE